MGLDTMLDKPLPPRDVWRAFVMTSPEIEATLVVQVSQGMKIQSADEDDGGICHRDHKVR